jgi:hypothetical protein
MSWKKLHLERLLLPRHVSAAAPFKSTQCPHLCLRCFSTLSWPLSPFFLFYYGSHPPVCTLYPLLQCPHTSATTGGVERHAALTGQSLKERLAPIKQVPTDHFSSYHCPQISHPSHLLVQSSFQKSLLVVRFLVGSVFCL